MLTVTVNDRPLDVAAIVERGRVLLPMRATFDALGASIAYDANGRTIVARTPAHRLELRVGDRTANLDNRTVRLDVAPRVVAARVYVPLRFVAQSIGAVVGYDARANLVSIVTQASSGNYGVTALNPLPSSSVGTAYPTISASLGTANAVQTDVRLMLDGQDVTQLASFDGTTITYMPRMGLEPGTHTVTFSGRTLANVPFSASWSFRTSLQPAPDAPALDDYGYQFYADGPLEYYPGDWMQFTLVAPPGGSAMLQLCGLGYQYGLWNTGESSVYRANFPAPSGLWIPACSVTAIYTAWNGRQYVVPIPVVIGLYTQHHGHHRKPKPTPSPQPSPIPYPGGPHRVPPTPQPPHITPMPRSSSTPRPLPTHHPVPHPVHTAAPAPASPPPQPEHTVRPMPHPLPRPRKTP